MAFAARSASFQPTLDSIPPPNVSYRQKIPAGWPVYKHPLNPLSFLLRAASIYPEKLAIAHPDVEYPVFYSFPVWAQRVQNLAYALIQVGINPQDRVAVISPNAPLIADAHQGVLAARAILCSINTRLTPDEVAYVLEHSQSRIILVDHEFVHLVKDAKVPVIVSKDTGRLGDPYEDFLSLGRRFSAERGWWGLEQEMDEDAGAVLCYTSGTTGRPKGVLTTLRGSYLAAISNIHEAQMNRHSTYLWVVPMFHAAGWTFPWASTASCATQITLRTVSAPRIWNHLLNSDVTHYCAAPTVQISLINAPEARKLPKPVTVAVAGSAPTAQLIGELEKLGANPMHIYGLTETHGPFMHSYPHDSWSAMTLEERAKHMAHQGFSYITGQEARVVFQTDEADSELRDVPKDGKTIGEVVTSGNFVMKEYFRDPEATAKAFQGGYFHTGDLAVMYPDGSISIQDRSKDIIISGGENASSLAIEQALANYPDILEVAVVARPHAKWGERPMAFVTLRLSGIRRWASRGKEFEAELKKHARKTLPGFAVPEWVAVVDELPRSSTGKIQKVALRKTVAKL